MVAGKRDEIGRIDIPPVKVGGQSGDINKIMRSLTRYVLRLIFMFNKTAGCFNISKRNNNKTKKKNEHVLAGFKCGLDLEFV